MDLMVFRSFSSARRCSGSSPRRYASIDLGFFIMVPCLSVLFTKVLPLPAPAARDTCTFATTHRSGDNWFLPHSQLDASLTVELRSDVSLQVSGLNLNNAVFGFYNGNSQAQFSGQREYYGRSVIMSVKYGFGAVPGTR